jgi:hypothetical protein
MFVVSKKKYNELVSKLADMNKKIEDQQCVIDNYNEDNELVIDFEGYNAVSVERAMRDNDPCTIIGCFERNGNYNEYMFFTSNTIHSEIVQQFKDYLEDKKNIKKEVGE